ncbi:dipeptide/oligopeptide/nickel ABC transporter permease/ATP-binding protein [Psychromarinibacter sp. S121]|uniref:dipeptide/oligopeptide/nickel ABC transporter permease/ATP-binding protein n=1 Tax=Psychromarinibacter sp. S121 TaxID=3415127 RepID=UPI003C7C127D
MTLRRYLPFVALGAIVLIALATPLLPVADPIKMNIVARLQGISAEQWLGTDEYGRDLLSRLLWGARVSLAVAAATAVAACVIGGMLGIIAGYFGGWSSAIIMRATDVVLCLPHLLVAMMIVTLFGPGLSTLIPVLTFVYIPGFVRVAQVSTAMVRSNAFVEAVDALGVSKVRILLLTIVPNVAGPLLVQMSLTASSAIMLESGLSFLGLGVQPPAPSWGMMISSARSVMNNAPMLLVWPCVALVITVLSINSVCDALRDILDPQKIARPPRKFLKGLKTPAKVTPKEGALLDVQGLRLELAGEKPVDLVRGIDLHVAPSETLAIVGESGSGKSLTGLAVAGLLPPAIGVAEGTATIDGRNVLAMSDKDLRRMRGGEVSMVFQDPLSALNPVYTVGHQLAEAILAHRPMGRAAVRAEVVDLLRHVGIPDPVARAKNYPHEMSGGMRQRVMIAMAIANKPRLVIADEPTTALDVTVQAQVLELLKGLKEEQGLALIFISHSLPVVAEIADRVAVIYSGEIVEEGPAAEIFARPLHPYTRALLDSSPEGDALPTGIPGLVPTPGERPEGCVFATRCTHATDACRATHPTLETVCHERRTRCLRWKEVA